MSGLLPYGRGPFGSQNDLPSNYSMAGLKSLDSPPNHRNVDMDQRAGLKGRNPMKAHAPSRRDFLCGTSFVAVGLALGGSMTLAPDYAWALSTTALDAHTAQTLLAMARQLFPHDRLGDQYYATVVEAVDKQAASDAALRKLLTDGVARLDGARGIAWVQLSNGARNAVLKTEEAGEFFSTMRTATINNLYTNPLVYRFFGYEGSSVEHGGYIERGFDDIGWLPNA